MSNFGTHLAHNLWYLRFSLIIVWMEMFPTCEKLISLITNLQSPIISLFSVHLFHDFVGLNTGPATHVVITHICAAIYITLKQLSSHSFTHCCRSIHHIQFSINVPVEDHFEKKKRITARTSLHTGGETIVVNIAICIRR